MFTFKHRTSRPCRSICFLVLLIMTPIATLESPTLTAQQHYQLCLQQLESLFAQAQALQ